MKMSAAIFSLYNYNIFVYLFIIFGVICHNSNVQGSIGVCNGRLGNNLPPEKDVVDLYKATGIKKMRIYDPNQATLTALGGSDIELIVDVPNVDLPSLQSAASAANWVQTNIRPHFPATRIRIIAVGNEVDPEKQETSRFAGLVLPAMQNIYKALSLFNLTDEIKVSTATYSALLKDTYPPSNSTFKDDSFMAPIVRFLAETRAPLLANIYPYFAYIGDEARSIKLPFALFTAEEVVVRDGRLEYRNLFDAMVDGVYSALEKTAGGGGGGGEGVGVVVSESGWPSHGGAAASMENAGAYYRNLMNHVEKGTPKRPGKATETYLFAMFDENEKPGATSEQHFGLFYPNKEMKYEVKF